MSVKNEIVLEPNQPAPVAELGQCALLLANEQPVLEATNGGPSGNFQDYPDNKPWNM